MQGIVRRLVILLVILAAPKFIDDDADRAVRIKAGENFLGSHVDNWERCLDELPLELGKMSKGKIEQKVLKRVSREWWNGKSHNLTKAFAENGSETVYMTNPNYRATVNRKDGSSTIVFFSHDVTANPWVVKSPYSSVSRLGLQKSEPNESDFIPTLFKHQRLKVRDYQTSGGKHVIKLESAIENDFENLKFVELTFDDRRPPLPVASLIKFEDRHLSFDAQEFFEFKGNWLPTLANGSSAMGGDSFQNQVGISYEPQESLDTSQCYLEYYGLAPPGEIAVADFGRKSTARFWVTVVLAIIGAIGTMCYFYKRNWKEHDST